MRKSSRRYSELRRIPDFLGRFEYLNLSGRVGANTFGHDRFLNQHFYTSPDWRRVRDEVIIRDDGCDLGIQDRPILDKVLVHHMTPITVEDVLRDEAWILDPEFLICVSMDTHNAIHYGSADGLLLDPVERRPGDTKLW